MAAATLVLQEIRSYHRFVKVLMGLVALAAVAALARFAFGLGATTNLSDSYPWGLWVAFDVVTAVPLAAGAFTLGAIVHVFHIKKLEPLVRPAIVTGFLGYSLVCIGLLLDLGQPQRGWHTLVYPNVHSPMFEVSLCVMGYTTVLLLEFLSPVCERFGLHLPLRVLRNLEMPLVILSAMISTLHQSTIGTFFLIAVNKLHNLWYTPILPLLFWISAIATGISIVILEATMSNRWLHGSDESEMLEILARIVPYVLSAYLAVKLYSLVFLQQGPLFDRPGLMVLWMVEIGGGVIAPIWLFLKHKYRTQMGPRAAAAGLVVAGLVLNRFSVSMFGMIHEGRSYVPSVVETVITLGIISAEVLFFVLIAKYFPIFEHHPETVDSSIPDPLRRIEGTHTHA